jgi:hypothetical protein
MEILRARKSALEAGLPRKAVENVFGPDRSPSCELRINDTLDLLLEIARAIPDKKLCTVAITACEEAKRDLLETAAARSSGWSRKLQGEARQSSCNTRNTRA